MKAIEPIENMALSFAETMGEKGQRSEYGFSMFPKLITQYGSILELELKEIGYLVALTAYLQTSKKQNEKKSKLRVTRQVWVSDETIAEEQCTQTRKTIARIKAGLATKNYIRIITTNRRSDNVSLVPLFACLKYLADSEKTKAIKEAKSKEEKRKLRNQLKKEFEEWKNSNLVCKNDTLNGDEF